VAAIIEERCGARGAGRASTGRRAWRNLTVADPLDDRRDVGGRRAAAAADDADAVALDELLQRFGQRFGLLGEDRLAVGSLQGQAGVRYAGDGNRAELAEEADRIAHVLGPGRAVQADHVHPEGLERRQHRGDVGPEQHLAAVRQQRDGGVDRQRAPGALERLAGAEDRGLDLEDVLGGLNDDQIDAAVDQAGRLLGEDLDELREADLSQRRVL
jgi:hypothetical protein